jgi:Ca-activated chloride channel family protein
MGRDRILAIGWSTAASISVAVVAWTMVQRYEVADPRWLWGLGGVAIAGVLYILRSTSRSPRVVLPNMKAFVHGPVDLVGLFRHLPFALAIAGMGLLMLGMSRPQSKDSWQDVQHEGIDIMIAMDVSVSMLAKDLKPDRLEAAKRVAQTFIDGRPNDRIGLVVYEGEAYTQCPLTTDHRVLKDLFRAARPGLITGGTAVGLGLATALNRLRESEVKSKVVILLTDGMNNAGTVQPVDAALIAEQLGIRVYTIGVGTRGKALTPVAIYPDGQYRYDYVDVQIDEEMMTKVADITGGRYFRATDANRLGEVYTEIDRLEKTRIKVTEHSQRKDEHFPFTLVGAGLLAVGWLLDRTLLRSMA